MNTNNIERIEEIKKELEELENRDWAVEGFDESLDCTGETITVAGIEFDPSRVLKECDPIAYNCYLTDYNNWLISGLENELEQLQD